MQYIVYGEKDAFGDETAGPFESIDAAKAYGQQNYRQWFNVADLNGEIVFRHGRNLEFKPYTADEKRVCAYIQEVTDGAVGCGDDPIGFLIASHRMLVSERRLTHGR